MPYRPPSKHRPALTAKWQAEARLRDTISKGLPTAYAREELAKATAACRKSPVKK